MIDSLFNKPETRSKALFILKTGFAVVGLIYFVNALIHVVNVAMPIDLALRYWEVRKWINEGENIFLTSPWMNYPPSFHVLVWPFFGWADYFVTKWIWLGWSLVFLAITVLGLRWMLQKQPLSMEMVWVFLLSFVSWNGLYLGIGIGQFHLAAVGLFILGLWLCEWSRIPGWLRILVASLAFALSITKYSMMAPLVPVLLLHPTFHTAAAISIVINLVASLAVLHAYDMSVGFYIKTYLANGLKAVNLGNFDIHAILVTLGVSKQWYSIGSLSVLFVFLIWLIRNRKENIWWLLGVAAITARFWMYHNHYDNVILVFLIPAFVVSFKNRFEHFPIIGTVFFLAFTLAWLLPARVADFVIAGIKPVAVYQFLILAISLMLLLKNRPDISSKIPGTDG